MLKKLLGVMLSGVIALAPLQRPGIRIIPQPPSGGELITTADITCAGVFKTPTITTQIYTTAYPMAYKYESGTRHYFLYAGNGHVREYVEPTLSSCGTSIASMNTATNASFGGDWGTFPVNNALGYIPGDGVGTNGKHLFWDEDSQQLILSWALTYSAVVYTNSIAAATMNSGSHTLTVNGCWGFDTGTGLNQLLIGTGFMKIPPAWATANLVTGRTWAAGFGGSYGYATGNSYGPVVVAIDPPASNACAASTDYDITSYDILERHGPLSGGPTCTSGGSNNGSGLGCTPSGTPGTIKAAQTAFADYSVDMYGTTWDPYGGHGWHTWETIHSMGWYDDGVKYGVVVPYATPSGWINSTVAAGTVSSSQFTATTLDMHDGTPIQVGDLMWVQTCTPGVEANCSFTNGNHLSRIRVATVDQGTKVVTFTNNSAPTGVAGPHVPIVGGSLYAGAVYAHGDPASSRFTFRMQIYDPAQYAEVKATTRGVSDVVYAEDVDFSSLISAQFGAPYPSPAGGGGEPRVGGMGPNTTMVDTTAHQIMIVMNNVNNNPQNVVYVLDVSQARPKPSMLPSPAEIINKFFRRP